ncbi:hypothetical protein [Streptomyces sp. NPDC046978]|uniref:hypothetical protein n=1 Tax=unclassified Streptomyces TaxID=2593676 RepID=UPI003409EA69
MALLLSEVFRHGKAIGTWAGGERALEAAGVPADAPGVLLGDSGTTVPEQLTSLLGAHPCGNASPWVADVLPKRSV